MLVDFLPRRWTDIQVPEGEQLFIDHAGYFLDDLDAAAGTLRRLGFAPSPQNLQTRLDADGSLRPSGTSNRLVRLRRGFLEFLAATHDTPIAEQLKAARARYAGLHLVAFSGSDLKSRRSRLIEAGFEMQEIIKLRRYAKEPGAQGWVEWSVLRPQSGVMPEGRMQFVYPHTPELSWPPGTWKHPNRADSLTSVVLCVPEPKAARQRFSLYLGVPLDGPNLETDRGRLTIVGPDEAGRIFPDFLAPSLPFVCAITLTSTDLRETRKFLEENDIPICSEQSGFLWVAPGNALGGYMGFHQRTGAA